MEDEALEVDLTDHTQRPLMWLRPLGGKQDQSNRGDCSEEHCANSVWHLENALTQPAEEGGNADKDAEKKEHNLGYREVGMRR